MAIDYSQYKFWDVPVYMHRMNPIPLDSTSVFNSMEEAEEYMSSPIAYPGQIVSVIDDDTNTSTPYIVSPDKKLIPLASSTDAIDEAIKNVIFKADTPSDAISEIATAENVGRVITVANDDTEGDNPLSAGLYIVTAPGTIQKLALSSGTENDYTSFESRIAALEGWKEKISTIVIEEEDDPEDMGGDISGQ